MRIETKRATKLFIDPSDLTDLFGNLRTKDITIKEFYFEAQSIENVSAEGDKVFMAFKTENGDKQEILNLTLDEKEAAHLAGRLNYELVRIYKEGKDV